MTLSAEQVKEVTIPARIAQLVHKHGGLRVAALALQIDSGYLSRLARGQKTDPSPRVLKKLGLQRIVTYRRK